MITEEEISHQNNKIFDLSHPNLLVPVQVQGVEPLQAPDGAVDSLGPLRLHRHYDDHRGC